jgi:hypothetical protein
LSGDYQAQRWRGRFHPPLKGKRVLFPGNIA